MVLIGLALVAAVLDWRAVAREDIRGEHVFKPLTLALLIGAALFLRGDVDGLRWALTLGALGFSLVGDVFLMLRPQRFVAGLGSFLVAHLAYVGAFRTLALDLPTLLAGGAVLGAGFVVNARLRRGWPRPARASWRRRSRSTSWRSRPWLPRPW